MMREIRLPRRHQIKKEVRGQFTEDNLNLLRSLLRRSNRGVYAEIRFSLWQDLSGIHACRDTRIDRDFADGPDSSLFLLRSRPMALPWNGEADGESAERSDRG